MLTFRVADVGDVGNDVYQVNGQSLLGCSHQDAVNALRSVGTQLAISVCDGFDPSVLSSLEGGSPTSNRNSVIRYNSQSSVDRDSSDVCVCVSYVFLLHISSVLINLYVICFQIWTSHCIPMSTDTCLVMTSM